MVKYNGINHLAMATSDMDMTIRFWRDLLGMRLVAGVGGGGSRHYFFEISENDLIAFFEWPSVERVPEKDHGEPVKGRLIFDHVSIGVESDDDLWALKDRLEANGIWVSEVVDHGFIHSIYAFDPNHIPIEFSADVNGIDVRKYPKMKDHHPTTGALEGSEPQPGHWAEAEQPTPPGKRRIHPGAGMSLGDAEASEAGDPSDPNRMPV